MHSFSECWGNSLGLAKSHKARFHKAGFAFVCCWWGPQGWVPAYPAHWVLRQSWFCRPHTAAGHLFPFPDFPLPLKTRGLFFWWGGRELHFVNFIAIYKSSCLNSLSSASVPEPRVKAGPMPSSCLVNPATQRGSLSFERGARPVQVLM